MHKCHQIIKAEDNLIATKKSVCTISLSFSNSNLDQCGKRITTCGIVELGMTNEELTTISNKCIKGSTHYLGDKNLKFCLSPW